MNIIKRGSFFNERYYEILLLLGMVGGAHPTVRKGINKPDMTLGQKNPTVKVFIKSPEPVKT
jgi:hypothetical protein